MQNIMTSKKVKPFSSIKIDTKTIPQQELDIDDKIRSNPFAWNGQFSPQFVEALLKYYADPDDVVFDPFLGSGTTLCEAARKGLSCFGSELNVSAFYMAKSYEVINLNTQERDIIIAELEEFIDSITDSEQIISIILKCVENNKDTLKGNLLCTLIILMDIFQNEVSIELLKKKWELLKKIVLECPYSNRMIKAYMCDARRIPALDNSASLLITSPPYINVFNYHQKYRRSVEALGYNVLSIAKNEFGSNRKNRGNRFLTVIQYCIDMSLAMIEASRICRDGTRMIYVVGRESTVLGYSFCNSQLIYEIGTEILGFDFLTRQERKFRNRFGQLIYEDILSFSNVDVSNRFDEETVTSAARSIAVRMLKEKVKSNSENKNKKLLEEAIVKANNVLKSEG